MVCAGAGGDGAFRRGLREGPDREVDQDDGCFSGDVESEGGDGGGRAAGGVTRGVRCSRLGWARATPSPGERGRETLSARGPLP